jgi:amino acid transporter
MLFVGAAGALLINAGAVVSMTGNNLGAVLTGSRMLFALAENGELPAFFKKIHPHYRTPSNAVIFTTLAALGLALSGSFVILALASAVARLVAYTGACAATLWLRRARFERVVGRATFVTPGGSLVPVAAIAVSLMILAGATRQQLLGGAAGLALGAVLFVANHRLRADAD